MFWRAPSPPPAETYRKVRTLYWHFKVSVPRGVIWQVAEGYTLQLFGTNLIIFWYSCRHALQFHKYFEPLSKTIEDSQRSDHLFAKGRGLTRVLGVSGLDYQYGKKERQWVRACCRNLWYSCCHFYIFIDWIGPHGKVLHASSRKC